MAAHKHKLTTGMDRITGGTGADLFVGALSGGFSTLNSNDTLNGGKGVDTIRATLGNAGIAPVMKNIENGIFSTGSVGQASLDLSASAQMTHLTFKQNADHPALLTTVQLLNAEHVSSIAINNTTDNAYELNNLSNVKNRSMQLSFDGATNTSLALTADNHDTFKSINVTLANNAQVELSSNAVAAANLTIDTVGPATQNQLTFSPVMASHHLQHLTVLGDANLNLFALYGGFQSLKSLDASHMTGNLQTTIGGDDLTSVKDGAGSSHIILSTVGGDDQALFKASLGAGVDSVELRVGFDASTQHFDGGAGYDYFTLDGAAADIGMGMKHFESLAVQDAIGQYDMANTGIQNFTLLGAKGLVTIDHLAAGATLQVTSDISTFLDVNVDGAAGSTADRLTVLLNNAATLGTAAAGFAAPDLSNLEIYSFAKSHSMYLAQVGSVSDPATVTITGDQHLTLSASNASTSYIQYLSTNNDAGIDISGLADGGKAFADTGATIIGGQGDDVLVGGDGSDHISTGLGNNTVHGSLGADIVTLLANSGLDMFVFDSQGQSGYGNAHDTINNFGIFDGIDISAVASDVTFEGNFSDNAAGIAALSSSKASAYYNTSEHMLYIDLNHDKQFFAAHDMQIQLNDVDTFQAANLLS